MADNERVAQSTEVPGARASTLLKKAFSFPSMLAVLLAGAIYVPLRNFWVDPDVWWHIKVGASILSTHHWPTMDTYSFTARGAPWVAYEWLGEVLLAAVERSWGLRGLLVLDVALASAILIALYALMAIRCGNAKAAAAVCAVYLPLVYPSCSLRPQMLGYVFLLVTLIILERFRQGHAALLWLLPPLFLVWVNTHGSFAFGLLALGIYWASGLVQIRLGELESRLWTAGERLRLEAVALFSIMALTVTPYGTGLCHYLMNIAVAQPVNLGNIQEWQSMSFDHPFGLLFLALLLAFGLAQIAWRPAWRLEEIILFLIGIVVACLHVRFLLVFVPFSAPLLGVVVARWFPSYDPANDKYALNASLIALALAAIVFTVPSRAELERLLEQNWPVRAVAYLRRNPVPRPMYNAYAYGGFLTWQLDGKNQVFIDGRADIYEPPGVLNDYLQISRLAFTTPFLLDSYGVKSCLIARNEALATLLANSSQWQKVYSDPLSVLFVRREQKVGGKPEAEHGHS